MKPVIIEDKIRAILSKDIKKRGLSAKINNSDSLIASGILDSLATITLIAELEKTFNIKIDPQDMVESNFDSVIQITGLVNAKLNRGG